MVQWTTSSPVNQEDTEAQNNRLIAYLSAGNTIHVMDPAKNILEIGYLNSRMSDIRKKRVMQGEDLFKRWIWAVGRRGKRKRVVEYSFFEFK